MNKINLIYNVYKYFYLIIKFYYQIYKKISELSNLFKVKSKIFISIQNIKINY
jgi:hypothetical protein